MYYHTKQQIDWTVTKWYVKGYDHNAYVCPDCVCDYVERNYDVDYDGESYHQCGGNVIEELVLDNECDECGRAPKPVEITRIWSE